MLKSEISTLFKQPCQTLWDLGVSIMWIARRTDYATRALLALALAPGNDPVKLQTISERTHVPGVRPRTGHAPAPQQRDRPLRTGAGRRLSPEQGPGGDHARGRRPAVPGAARAHLVRDAEEPGAVSDDDRVLDARRLGGGPRRDDQHPRTHHVRRPRRARGAGPGSRTWRRPTRGVDVRVKRGEASLAWGTSTARSRSSPAPAVASAKPSRGGSPIRAQPSASRPGRRRSATTAPRDDPRNRRVDHRGRRTCHRRPRRPDGAEDRERLVEEATNAARPPGHPREQRGRDVVPARA